MKILAIETSCDETAAAVVSKNPQENYVKVLSNTVASSLVFHSKTGGIIPNVAAREQLKFIIPVIEKAFASTRGVDAQNPAGSIDAIAVTVGPGLIGSLLVGVETAKTLSYLWNKPIIPVNHLLGHIYANFIQAPKLDARRSTLDAKIDFPAIALLVSGGHTDLLLMKSHDNFKWLGGTLDDAAGEAFDKIGRLLNLPYPGGPAIEKAAERGIEGRFTFPSPMIYSKDFNFSFSGLKAATLREVKKIRNMDEQTKADIAASAQRAIVDVLVKKTMKATYQYNVKSILLGGGVASNQNLRDEFKLRIVPPQRDPAGGGKNCLPTEEGKLKIKLFYPEKSLCTDNAAMIGAYALFHPDKMSWGKIIANPELYFYA